MNFKWCACTGLVMIVAAVLIVWTAKDPDQDQPGVKRRWWDGTIESVEDREYDGTLRSRTLYGDDGQTVVRFEHYNFSGELEELRVRRPDGKVEKKQFMAKTLILHELYLPDMSVAIEGKEWYSADQLRSEFQMSEDGKLTKLQRLWYPSGQMQQESILNDSGEHIHKTWFPDGKLSENLSRTLQGTFSGEWYYPNGKLLRKRNDSREKGVTIELFAEDGQTKARHEEPADGNQITITIFENGKPAFRQIYLPFDENRPDQRALSRVEELFEDGKVKREITIKFGIDRVKVFREDGSLLRDQIFEDGKVKTTTEYDAEGKAGENQAAEPETVDSTRLQLYRLGGEL